MASCQRGWINHRYLRTRRSAGYSEPNTRIGLVFLNSWFGPMHDGLAARRFPTPGHMLSVRGTSRGDCIRRVAPRFEEQAGDRDRDNRRHRGAGHNLPEQTDYMLRTYPPTSEDWATVLVVLNLDMDGRRRDAASLCHRDPACRPVVLCRRGVCAGRPQAARRYLTPAPHSYKCAIPGV
jgi:hypothetical protein